MKFAFVALAFVFVLSPALSHAQNQDAPAGWTEKIKVKGDFRFRTERIFAQGSKPQLRNRVRLRPGAAAAVNEYVTLNFRFATANSASESSTSSDVTLDDASAKKQTWVDLAYADWKPFEDVSVWMGKTPNLYWSPGSSELVWDQDFTFEGAGAKWKLAPSFSLNAGGHWLNERADTTAEPGPDLFLSGTQAVSKFKIGDLDTAVSLAYYTYAGLAETAYLGRGQRGNAASAVTAGSYTTDFLPLVAALEVGSGALGLPAKLFFEWAENTAVAHRRAAALGGVIVGELNDPGSWQACYMFRQVEQNALVGAFNDSDFGAGADVRFHKLFAQVQAAAGVIGSLSVYAGEMNIATAPRNYDRAQLDFRFEF